MKTLEIEFEGKGEVSGINFKQLSVKYQKKTK